MSANRRLKRIAEVALAKRIRKQHRSEYAQTPIRNPTAASNKEYWDWVRSVAEKRQIEGPLPDQLTVHPDVAERIIRET